MWYQLYFSLKLYGREAGQDIPHLHVHTIPRSIVDGAATVDSMFKNKPK